MENVARMKGLITVLLDKTARDDEREDAAMDLDCYNDISAINALVYVASDAEENYWVVDACAETIGAISVEFGFFDEAGFQKLVPLAQETVFHYIVSNRPDLIRPKLREELLEKYPLPDDLYEG